MDDMKVLCLTAYNEYTCNNRMSMNIEMYGLSVSSLISYKYSRELFKCTNLFYFKIGFCNKETNLKFSCLVIPLVDREA